MTVRPETSFLQWHKQVYEAPDQLWFVVETHRREAKLTPQQQLLTGQVGSLRLMPDPRFKSILRLTHRDLLLKRLRDPEFRRVVLEGKELKGLHLVGYTVATAESKYEGRQGWWLRPMAPGEAPPKTILQRFPWSAQAAMDDWKKRLSGFLC